jgi:photosystem II stability/assembly factor-like uncharacterized protein
MSPRREPFAVRLVRATLAGIILTVLAATSALGASSAQAAAGKATAPVATALRAPAAAPGAWRQLPDPFAKGVRPAAMATFGKYGVAIVADGGLIAVSQDAGATWSAHNGPGGQAFTTVAFSDASHGWAGGPAGFLMRTADGGATWSPRYIGILGTVAALAARGSFIYTLGSRGIVTSTDGGATWQQQADATATAGLTSIAADDSGFAVAAGADPTATGITSVDSGDGTWTAAAQVSGSTGIVALALAASPQWDDGTPDLFAVTGSGVLASDDQGATFTALPSPPQAGLLSASVIAGPSPVLLAGGGAGWLERCDLTSLSWTGDSGPVGGDIVSCAAGPGSIAYAVSSSGHVERTMSYGEAPGSVGATPAAVTAGGSVDVTVSSPIRATGTLVLESSAAGGRWTELARWPWSANPPAPEDVIDAPLATTSYRVRFIYGGATGATSAAAQVGVRPRIALQRWTFNISKGDIYRVTGRVLPPHPGGQVQVWTDRGGKWHKIALGGDLRLAGGTSFSTRLFGTPIRESYHLQIRMDADAGHLAGRSRIVQVTIR